MCCVLMALRRDSVKPGLLPARSIEETGLDPSLCGGFPSPHVSPTPVCSKSQHKEDPSSAIAWGEMDSDANRKPDAGRECTLRRRKSKGKGSDLDSSSSADNKQVPFLGQDENKLQTGFSQKRVRRPKENSPHRIVKSSSERLAAFEFSLFVHNQECAEQMDEALEDKVTDLFCERDTFEAVSPSPDVPAVPFVSECFDDSSFHCTYSPASGFPLVPQDRLLEEAEHFPQPLDTSSLSPGTVESLSEISDDTPTFDSKQSVGFASDGSQKDSPSSSVSRKLEARRRWKYAGHSVKFINRLASNIRVASTDLVEDRVVDEMMQQQLTEDDAGRVGAAAFEGARTVACSRLKGRKGMEGLVVKQDRSLPSFFQDFYVACLKMPIGHFLVGVLLAPLVLGLLFTPLYLLDIDGLSFDGVVPEDAATSPLASAKQRCLAFLNIFLYALSLSTTFGGAPVAARSPFCLLMANVNTLLAQVLFVFLSGAVFARMSQPSYPIRCSKKAIIKTDDLPPVLGLEQEEKFKVFAVRLVLTGPSPCELVDAKICLTFRIFVTLPSGYVFCSTQDLEIVRPEVSYLRYGLMVRHIIDKKSPIYGHTMASLYEGDASFSLTVMGLERTSMQSVFHLEDYFVSDNDVIWERDYADFIHIDKKGRRVLDHSQIDILKPMKAAARATQAVERMKNLSHQKQEKEEMGNEPEISRQVEEASYPIEPRNWFGSQKEYRLLKSMSTSFKRAHW